MLSGEKEAVQRGMAAVISIADRNWAFASTVAGSATCISIRRLFHATNTPAASYPVARST